MFKVQLLRRLPVQPNILTIMDADPGVFTRDGLAIIQEFTNIDLVDVIQAVRIHYLKLSPLEEDRVGELVQDGLLSTEEKTATMIIDDNPNFNRMRIYKI